MKGCQSFQLGRQDCGQLCDDRIGGADGFMQAALRTDDRDLRVKRLETGDEICRNGSTLNDARSPFTALATSPAAVDPSAPGWPPLSGLRIGHDPVERRGGWRPGLGKFLGLFLVDGGQRQLTGGVSPVDAGDHPVGLFQQRVMIGIRPQLIPATKTRTSTLFRNPPNRVLSFEPPESSRPRGHGTHHQYPEPSSD